MKTNLEELRRIRNNIRKNNFKNDDELVDMFNTANQICHDGACEIASTMLGIKVIDTPVSQVFPNVPLRNPKQTPDIVWIESLVHRTCWIGDVAVTSNYVATLRQKREKYHQLINDLKMAGWTVKEKWMVFLRDLRNLGSLAEKFNARPVPKEKMLMFSDIASMTDEIRSEIDRKVTDWVHFRNETANETYTETDFGFSSDYMFDLPPKEELNMTDKDIFDFAYKEMERTRDTYFDSGRKEEVIAEAFRSVREKIEEMDDRKIVDFTQLAGNYLEMEEKVDLDLAEDWYQDLKQIPDNDVAAHILGILNINFKTAKEANINKRDKNKNGGKSRYEIPKLSTTNHHDLDVRRKLEFGRKKRNVSTKPASLKKHQFGECLDYVEGLINYLGGESDKPPMSGSRLLLSKDVEVKYNIDSIRKMEKVMRTCAVQMTQTAEFAVMRVLHSTSQVTRRPRIIVPPSGAFIMVIPDGHGLVLGDSCEVPFFTMWRCTTGKPTPFYKRLTCSTSKYDYYVSKLWRLNMDKMQNWIASTERALTAAMSILHVSDEPMSEGKVIGTCAVLTLDIHQKTSDMLDLFKYTAWQPQAELTRMKDLLSDKLNIMYKTPLDVWVMEKMRRHMLLLAASPKPRQPKVLMSDGKVQTESFGVTDLRLPSFVDMASGYRKPEGYVCEMAALFSLRGKKLYGEQFMDASFHSYVDREKSLLEEDMTDGWSRGYDTTPFPFDRKYAYSKDLIIHMINEFEPALATRRDKVMANFKKESGDLYLHEICSLRGCMKEETALEDSVHIHSTSMHEALKFYDNNKVGTEYDEEKCKLKYAAASTLKPKFKWMFSMSAKEQRGGGRVICSPGVKTKAGLRMVEGPEMALGKEMPDNVIVSGVNKITSVHENFVKTVAEAVEKDCKVIYQVTEDQSKWSEEDNNRKYLTLTRNRVCFPGEVNRMQYNLLAKLQDRLHFNNREVPQVTHSDFKILFPTKNNANNCVKISHGWPQGMLNHISTTIHSYVSRYSVILWNRYNNEADKIVANGEVHSDDSHITVAARNKDTIRDYIIFRNNLKRMAAIRNNVKKTYASSWCGEMVSNYCLNGQMVIPWVKMAINCFQNQQFISYHQDTLNIFSNMHQLVTNGCPLFIMAMTEMLMKRRLDSAYSMKKFKYDRSLLPIQMGGYPCCNIFELAVSQASAHELRLRTEYVKPDVQDSVEFKAAMSALSAGTKMMAEQTKDVEMTEISSMKDQIEKLQVELHQSRELMEEQSRVGDLSRFEVINDIVRIEAELRTLLEKLRESESTVDWDMDKLVKTVTALPREGDIFHYITTAFPVRKSTLATVNAIRKLDVVDDGLGELVTRPLSIGQALGHLKGRALNAVYELSESGYLRSKKRLYAHQALSATGKIWGMRGWDIKMTLPQLIETLAAHYKEVDKEYAGLAYQTMDINTVHVENMTAYAFEVSKTKEKPSTISNIQPIDTESRLTVSNIKDVLLLYTSTENFYKFGSGKTSYSLAKIDLERLKENYKDIFRFYPREQIPRIMLRMSRSRRNKKYWISKPANKLSMSAFYKDIYENTISYKHDVTIKLTGVAENINRSRAGDMISTWCTLTLASHLYQDNDILPKQTGESWSELLRIRLDDITQDEYAKYIWTMYSITGDRQWVDMWSETEKYREQYLVRQKFANGKYFGNLVVKAQEGKDILIFDKNDNGWQITTNTLATTKIMMMMRKFVFKNFRDLSYNDAKSWGAYKVWETTRIGKQYLTFYGKSATVISRSQNGTTSIPIVYDRLLKGMEKDTARPALEYRINPEKINTIQQKKTKEDRGIFDIRTRGEWFDILTIKTYPIITYGLDFEWVPGTRIAGSDIKMLYDNKVLAEALLPGDKRLGKTQAMSYLRTAVTFFPGIAAFIANTHAGVKEMTEGFGSDIDTSDSDVETVKVEVPELSWEEVVAEFGRLGTVDAGQLEIDDSGEADMDADLFAIYDRCGMMVRRDNFMMQCIKSMGQVSDLQSMESAQFTYMHSYSAQRLHVNWISELGIQDTFENLANTDFGDLEDDVWEKFVIAEATIILNGWQLPQNSKTSALTKSRKWKKGVDTGVETTASKLVAGICSRMIDYLIEPEQSLSQW
uniref:RNA-directed RNA polymerase L n=1 Tax=Mastotermes darwiniensis phasmavirus 1 TaxID=3133465 RepID=A0AAT9J9P8_9VIRU